MKVSKIRSELEGLLGDGKKAKIAPADVLRYGTENRESAIGKYLDNKGCFDPEKAMAGYGLLVAQHLIRKVRIKILPAKDQKAYSVRFLTSLVDERKKGGSSYRRTESVLSSDVLRAKLVETILGELRSIRYAHAHLGELSAVWQAIDSLSNSDEGDEQ